MRDADENLAYLMTLAENLAREDLTVHFGQPNADFDTAELTLGIQSVAGLSKEMDLAPTALTMMEARW